MRCAKARTSSFEFARSLQRVQLARFVPFSYPIDARNFRHPAACISLYVCASARVFFSKNFNLSSGVRVSLRTKNGMNSWQIVKTSADRAAFPFLFSSFHLSFLPFPFHPCPFFPFLRSLSHPFIFSFPFSSFRKENPKKRSREARVFVKFVTVRAIIVRLIDWETIVWSFCFLPSRLRLDEETSRDPRSRSRGNSTSVSTRPANKMIRAGKHVINIDGN